MERSELIPLVLRKVASKVLKEKDYQAVYKAEKGFQAASDMLAHETFVKEIKSRFPDDSIYSEEDTQSHMNANTSSEFSWIVDPICGTTNYLYNIPFYSHSLTLLQNNNFYAAGVYDPMRDELFFSSENKFYLNNQIVNLKKEVTIGDALISINTNQSNFDDEGTSLQNIMQKLAPPTCRRIHILESANLELAYVACGRLDAYFNPTDKPWDIAASKLFIPAAGGAIKIWSNEEQNIFKQKGILAAGSEKLLNQIVDLW